MVTKISIFYYTFKRTERVVAQNVIDPEQILKGTISIALAMSRPQEGILHTTLYTHLGRGKRDGIEIPTDNYRSIQVLDKLVDLGGLMVAYVPVLLQQGQQNTGLHTVPVAGVIESGALKMHGNDGKGATVPTVENGVHI